MAQSKPPSSSLQVEPVTTEDIPALTDIIMDGFSTPHDRIMFPDTPGIREWWDNANRNDILHKPDVKYVKVVDSYIPGSILAYAKWDFNPKERGHRFPPWHADSDAKACSDFFEGCEVARKAIMHDRSHYYLDMLATHSSFRRRGAATMLLRWGCDQADQAELPVYIDSSDDGVPVYERYGFYVVSGPRPTPEGISAMLREPQTAA
ncbi:acyl-CoA N-acyltransferase [Aspergillus ambiguus]|uniref:GNAT family N-acetyltransferase n=1 Tax=Aspergillus ambiguus TaxID=176160 RepID=UPI003CCD6A1E